LLMLGVITALSAGKIPIRFPRRLRPRPRSISSRSNPLQGNMFNNDEIGDYVIYWLYPNYKVFMDGRSDMYGESILKEYLKVSAIETGWKDVLDKYDINYIFYYTELRACAAPLDGGGLAAYLRRQCGEYLPPEHPEERGVHRPLPPSGRSPAPGR